MADSTVDLLKSVNISTELASADLGDKRRTKRLANIVEAMSCRPECSIPQIFDDEAGLEGYYRFIDNDNVCWRSIFKPHADATVARAEHFDSVLVLHDTTEFSFKIHDDNAMRANLSRVSSKTQGFSLHASLCCSADGLRAPLGLLEMQPFAHKKECERADSPEETCAFWQEQGGFYDHEQCRWLNSILKAEKSLCSKGLKGIHLGDRETDDYGLVAPLVERDIDFVFRFYRKRRVHDVDDADGADGEAELLEDMIASTAPLGTRQVELGPRADPGHERLRKRFPKRDGRMATLEFRAKKVVFPRPASQPEDLPSEVTVWVVEALEINPPEGEKPVHWLLVTSQECETLEQTLKVVDHYRGRWLIEEFFKSLKSGQRYEKLQHQSAHALLNALAVKSVIAWQALVLRYFSRHYPDYPAQMVVTRNQLLILLHKKPRIFKEKRPTVREAMMAVASLGGHIKNNGDPGWMVIMRGLKNLNDLHAGWNIAMEHAKKM
jgi:hypothetical protein